MVPVGCIRLWLFLVYANPVQVVSLSKGRGDLWIFFINVKVWCNVEELWSIDWRRCHETKFLHQILTFWCRQMMATFTFLFLSFYNSIIITSDERFESRISQLKMSRSTAWTTKLGHIYKILIPLKCRTCSSTACRSITLF